MWKALEWVRGEVKVKGKALSAAKDKVKGLEVGNKMKGPELGETMSALSGTRRCEMPGVGRDDVEGPESSRDKVKGSVWGKKKGKALQWCEKMWKTPWVGRDDVKGPKGGGGGGEWMWKILKWGEMMWKALSWARWCESYLSGARWCECERPWVGRDKVKEPELGEMDERPLVVRGDVEDSESRWCEKALRE